MEGNGTARYGRRLSASKVPVAPQPVHVSSVDLERQRRYDAFVEFLAAVPCRSVQRIDAH
jgi:hypothetical protein